MASTSSSNPLIRTIRNAVIGDREAVPTALGPRRSTYVDFTASGRSLAFVEQLIADSVMPLYSNTHSTTSEVGFQSHCFFSEARDILRDSTNASEKDDVVLFVGRGATGAVNTLAHHLIGHHAAGGGASSSNERAGRNFTQYLQNALADKDETILTLSDSLAAATAGKPKGTGRATAPAASSFDCMFPGCSRSFPSAVDLHMHARTHPDGEATAWRLHHPTSSSGHNSDGSSNNISSGSSTSAYSAIVLIGPYAHHSSILPWRDFAGGDSQRVLLLHVKGQPPASSSSSSTQEGWWGVDAVDLNRQIQQAIRLAVLGPTAGSISSSSSSLSSSPLSPAAFFAALKEEYNALSTSLPSLPPLIASFTAASNVTGAMVNADRVTAVFNCYEALWQRSSFASSVGGQHKRKLVTAVAWDCAASAPHTGVDMNPKRTFALRDLLPSAMTSNTAADDLDQGGGGDRERFGCSKDAVYFSMHKFLGGPSSPGILILKRRLLSSRAPPITGGGTVFFVNPDGTPRYLANDAEREEAGSPDLLASVRAGLTFHVMRSVGMTEIAAREGAMAAAARLQWSKHPRVKIMGSEDASSTPRVPIVSFLVASSPPAVWPAAAGIDTTGGKDDRLFLHWSFVTAVLNDVFGIQARGGCLCAGPYLHHLLGISEKENEDSVASSLLEERLLQKDELLRPGVVRVSFPYHLSHESYRYLVDAVEWVATHGEKLLWLYTPIHDTGEWRINRSLAWSLLGEGYRLLGIQQQQHQTSSDYTNLNTELSAVLEQLAGATTVPSAAAQTAACPFSLAELASAKGVIARATKIPGKEGLQHATEGHRGGIKTHPRRWLQSLKLKKEDGRIVRPDYRILIDIAEGSGQSDSETETASASASVAPAKKVTEGELLKAYLAEAWLVLAAAWVKRPSNAAALSHHQAILDASSASSSSSSSSSVATADENSTGTGTARGSQHLARWFALASDLPAQVGGLPQGASAPAAAAAVDADAGNSSVSICRSLQVYQPSPWLEKAALGANKDLASSSALVVDDDDEDGRFSNFNHPAWLRPDAGLISFLTNSSGGDADDAPQRAVADFNGLIAASSRGDKDGEGDEAEAELTEERKAGAGTKPSNDSAEVDFFYTRSDGLKAAEASALPSPSAVYTSKATKAKKKTVDVAAAEAGEDDRLAKAASRSAPLPIPAATAAAEVTTPSSSAAASSATPSKGDDDGTKGSKESASALAFRERAKEYALTSQAMKRLLPDPLAKEGGAVKSKAYKKAAIANAEAASADGSASASVSASSAAAEGAAAGAGGAGSGAGNTAKTYHSLRRDMLEAIQDFSMIHEGDRLLVGLSGGKDSLSMLIMLLYIRERFPVRFDIACCTVDPQYSGFDPSPLKKFLKDLNIPYFYQSEGLIDLASEKMTGNRESICAWCSRMKRGILYSTARRHGYNVLVLGQHADDAAESFIMSSFRNGLLRTMKAHYLNDDGDIRIIRPLIYARARTTREFAYAMKLPIISDNCPACFAAPQVRADTAKLLAYEESKNPALFSSLKRAMKVLFTDGGARAVRKLQKRVDAEGEYMKKLKQQGLEDLRKGRTAAATDPDEDSGLTSVIAVSAKIGVGGLLSVPPLYTALPKKATDLASSGEGSTVKAARPVLTVDAKSGAALAAAEIAAAGGRSQFRVGLVGSAGLLSLSRDAATGGGDEDDDDGDSEEEEERKAMESGACPLPARAFFARRTTDNEEASGEAADATATGSGSRLMVEDDGKKLKLTFIKKQQEEEEDKD